MSAVDEPKTTDTTPTEQPYATFDEINAAPSDIVEKDITVTGWGRLRIRSLTAAQNGRINQDSAKGLGSATPEIRLAEFQKARFRMGVKTPRLSVDQVNVIYHESGPRFMYVLEQINEISGTSEEELRKAQEAFQTGGGDES